MPGYGLDRVLEPPGVLPQQAWRVDNDPIPRRGEVAIEVIRLNLDAASFRQLREAHGSGIRDAVLDIVAQRGKMHNPVTGSGGMLLGVVSHIGEGSRHGLVVGDQVATLVSLSLTPLLITDGLARWDGRSEQIPCSGTAIVLDSSSVAVLPPDLPRELALAVLDVCGAPALTDRIVRRRHQPTVAVVGGGGKSGSLVLAAAARAGAARRIAIVPTVVEAELVRGHGIADEVFLADARDPLSIIRAIGQPVDITVVCVDVPGCEHSAILATKNGGTVVFFSMATSFSAATLGAEGLAADVELLMGNGFVPGHAELALDLIRTQPGVRALFERRISENELT